MLPDTSSVADMGLNPAAFIGSLLWNAAPWMLLSGLAGLLLAIFLIIHLAKRQLMTRHTYTWNLLAKLGYLVILVTLPLGAAALGGVYGIHSKVNAEVEQGVRPILATRMPQLRAYVTTALQHAGNQQNVNIDAILKPVKDKFSYDPSSRGWWERTKSYWINEVVVNPAFSLIGEVMQDKLIDSLGGSAVAGSKDGKRQVVNQAAALMTGADSADARKFDGELTQLVMANVLFQINGAFSPVYISILLIVLGIACLLIAEIIVYRRFYRPRPPSMAGQV
jgi:hypothetical protein